MCITITLVCVEFIHTVLPKLKLEVVDEVVVGVAVTPDGRQCRLSTNCVTPAAGRVAVKLSVLW